MFAHTAKQEAIEAINRLPDNAPLNAKPVVHEIRRKADTLIETATRSQGSETQ